MTVTGLLKAGVAPPRFWEAVKLAVSPPPRAIAAEAPPTSTVSLAAFSCTVVGACDPNRVTLEPAPGTVMLKEVMLLAYWSCKPALITSPALAASGKLLSLTFAAGAATIVSPPAPLPVTNTGLGPVPPVKKTGAFALPLTVMSSVSLPLPWSVVRRLAAAARHVEAVVTGEGIHREGVDVAVGDCVDARQV